MNDHHTTDSVIGSAVLVEADGRESCFCSAVAVGDFAAHCGPVLDLPSK